MEDIDRTISILQELVRCNDTEEVRNLKRKFEDMVGPTEKTNLNYESMPSIDQLNEQTKAFVLKVEKLAGRGMFPEGIALDEEKRGVILPTSKLSGETTAIRNMEKIYDFIIGDVKKIGVWGMGGIGKTTIMKHINNRILKEQKEKFDCVIWVTVSKDSSIFKLQDNIGQKLNVDLSNDGDTITRAGTLLEAFQKKRRYLLILDDLWEDYSLEEVGILDPNHADGCKLVLTSRLRQVCQRMECKAIKMDLLSEEEAWSLFLDHVGLGVLEVKGLEPIVKDVASECARLPLAITTIAKSMKGEKEACEWRDALKKLKASSMEPGDKGEKVIKQLKFSYDRLKNEKLKKCLLLCALYPEDKIIERGELIELLALDGIIEEKKSKSDEVDEGNVMLNNLIHQCLLEGGEYYYPKFSWVKMHDLVRDMAIQINGLHSKYLTVSGIELSNMKWPKKLLKIHISNCYSLNVSPMCPILTTFILKGNSLANIPDSFFQHFKALKILNLSCCDSLQVLLNSISDLVNLVGLLLRNCRKLTYVPPLTRLKDLQTLDLFVEMLPPNLLERKYFLIKDLEKLSNLRYVNLILCKIEVFPLGIIPRLSKLRYLVCNLWTKVSASELMCLENLEIFKGTFYDIHDLCVYVKHREQKISQLSSYLFAGSSTFKNDAFVNNYWYSYVDKVVILENCNLSKLAAENEKYLLPKDVQVLWIGSDPDLASLCALASLNYATDLRKCTIRDCNGVRELVSTSSSSSFLLPSLERLQLYKMKNLEALIGRKKKACNVFPYLRVLTFSECDTMKVVINIGLLSNLNNLELLQVHWCDEVEEIIGEGLDDEKDVNEGITQITLPNLRQLWLLQLPHLRSIYPASRPLICKSLQITLPNLRELWLSSVPHLRSICPTSRPLICKSLESGNLRELHITRGDRIKVVINIGLLSNLINLESLKVDSCKEVEEIIGEWLDDEKEVNEGVTQITLPNLRVLYLLRLPHLRSICPASRPLICKSLQYIYIEECPELVEQCVYAPWAWDERGKASPSASLQPIQLKSPLRNW